MATQRKTAAKKHADPTDRLPSLPPEGQQTVDVEVITTQEWYDNWRLHKEGEREVLTFPVGEDGEPILNPHVVLAEEYEPPEIDLPATTLDRRRRSAGVRGGASGMPNL